MTVKISTLEERITPPLSPNSPLQTEEYFVNMGPQHPATHGVLRLVVRMDGETVREIIPVPGYVHRGVEKIGEHQTYHQFTTMTDRIDYLSAHMNDWCLAKAVEKAAGIETNERIETIRTIMAELQRIQSHQLWWGVMAMDLGALTAFLYAFRDRETLCDVFEETMGARLTLNYIIPGGVMFDIHPNFVKRVKEFVKYFRPMIDEYDDLVSGNYIIQERTRGIGVLSKEDAIAYGATGPVIRGSGIPYDLRKLGHYGVYDKVDFDVAVGTVGDTWDRYYVRIEEMRQSLRIIEQLIDNIPEGPHYVLKQNAKVKVPKGYYYDCIETSRGELGIFIASDGTDVPYRINLRTPCFRNLQILTKLAVGYRVADLVAIMSTLDFVIPDIDR